jgi:hypothetical protein
VIPAEAVEAAANNSNRGEVMQRLLIKLSTRKCRGCDDASPHSHHLTRLGQWRYVDSWKFRK